MRNITPAERREALKSFVSHDEPVLEVVGRSEAEGWATCPAQQSLIEAGKEGPQPAYVETGEQVHQAFGKAIQAWIDSTGEIGPQGIREALEQALRGSRPDLQPQVIAAARASIWQFAAFLSEVNAGNILNFDGGEGELSGQLAMDMPTAGVRFTGEVDLLWAGPQRGVLQLEDFKSGWRFHRGGDVYQSFQFSSYSCLIFDNYPDIQAVECRVWDTRRGTKTYPVLFERSKLDNYLARIHGALQSRHDHSDNPVPWPEETKCSFCPVARHCPASGDIGEIAADPAAALRQFIALDAKYAAAKKLLTGYSDQHGPIVDGTAAFGRRPAEKPTAKLFTLKETESESE